MELQLETDLQQLEALARANWADNWNFRSYLMAEVEPREVDYKVQEIYTEVSQKIDCTSCGNCCRQIFPYLSPQDISRITKSMGLNNSAFKARYVRREKNGDQVFAELPCPMLSSCGRCTIYTARPSDCREYPHLHKPGFLSRSVGMIENYRICPIVFNVYERLKQSFAYNADIDYIGDTEVED